jgi:hypothetical protein
VSPIDDSAKSPSWGSKSSAQAKPKAVPKKKRAPVADSATPDKPKAVAQETAKQPEQPRTSGWGSHTSSKDKTAEKGGETVKE